MTDDDKQEIEADATTETIASGEGDKGGKQTEAETGKAETPEKKGEAKPTKGAAKTEVKEPGKTIATGADAETADKTKEEAADKSAVAKADQMQKWREEL